MRVNEVAKELGKTNKEVVDILQKNNGEVKSSQANASEEQAAAVKKEAAVKTEAGAAGETKEAPAQPAKKRITAVYRPQNSSQKGRQGQGRPQGQRPVRPAGGGMQVRPTTTSAPAGAQGRPHQGVSPAPKAPQAAENKPQAAPAAAPAKEMTSPAAAPVKAQAPAAPAPQAQVPAPEPQTAAPRAAENKLQAAPAAAPAPQAQAPARETREGRPNQGG